MMMLALLLPTRAAEEEKDQMIDNSEVAGRIRVRRGISACIRKCKNLGRKGGSCVSTTEVFYSFTCGGRGVVCECYN